MRAADASCVLASKSNASTQPDGERTAARPRPSTKGILTVPHWFGMSAISREVTDPNSVVIVNEFATLEGARAFSQDPSLPAAMERGGVEGPPQVWIVEEAEAKRY